MVSLCVLVCLVGNVDELSALSLVCSLLFSASSISIGSGLSLSSSINRFNFNLTLAFCKFETLLGSGLSLSSSINRFNSNLALAFCKFETLFGCKSSNGGKSSSLDFAVATDCQSSSSNCLARCARWCRSAICSLLSLFGFVVRVVPLHRPLWHLVFVLIRLSNHPFHDPLPYQNAGLF